MLIAAGPKQEVTGTIPSPARAIEANATPCRRLGDHICPVNLQGIWALAPNRALIEL
jgi:hypothetical protein